ncbi:MAG: arylsulfatase A [Rhodothermales bacterium]
MLGASTQPKHSPVINHSIGGQFAIRHGKWKLVLAKRVELYNLQDDSKETRNLAAAHPEMVSKLKAMLAEIRERGHSAPARPATGR